MSWVFVPATADSSLDCSSRPVVRLWASATWRGKHSGPRVWSLRWRRDTWLRRLSGLTCLRSTANHGVASWTASLRASRVNPGPLPDGNEGPQMSDGSGPRSPGWFAKFDPASSSWRTSQRSLLAEVSEMYSDRWPRAGTMRNGTVFELPKSAHRISGSGSSSWPTATAQDSASSGAAAYSTEGGRHSGTTLTDAARTWPTPKASRRGDCQSERGRRSLDLASQACGHQARVTPPDGTDTSPPMGLNPRFVEALMGVPAGWTSFDCSATEWSRWWRRMRSEFLRLGR
jgi:hypothetical protein